MRKEIAEISREIDEKFDMVEWPSATKLNLLGKVFIYGLGYVFLLSASIKKKVSPVVRKPEL